MVHYDIIIQSSYDLPLASIFNLENSANNWSIFISSLCGFSISGNTYVQVPKGKSKTFCVSWNICSENNKVNTFFSSLETILTILRGFREPFYGFPSKSKYLFF